jgi:hypothetical protein
MTWLLDRLRRFPCVFRGHDSVLHFESDRLSLRCLSCGYRTRGWRLGRDSAYAPLPIHELSPRSLGDPARPRVILDEKGGSTFAQHVSRADRFDEGSAASRPGAIGDGRKSRVMHLAS